MRFIGLRVIMRRLEAVFYLLRDRTVPLRKKALVIAGIIYLFLPVDLIPPVLFPFGFLDDLVLWAFIILHLKDELDSYWIGEKAEDLSKRFKKKDIIEGVDFNVEEEKDEE